MTLLSTLIGGVMGTGVHMFANSVQKVPLSRKPWCHVGYFFFGMYAANYCSKWETALLKEINQARASQGQSPMVGSTVLLPGYNFLKKDE
mmetsp:Transcript_2831/g.4337  ORF Transcript_2831/g.4337 Transcript_2831/m.4337 type:complete len:90 (+) Transcript_2831:95-364(+)|eukprot:CAMPEP_0195516674 /NCGR_PEP_ID=MMETSP0794_2-20130614/8274_1 /TAXON_ID=515487 /ORGANISM="Stephanopyxis turris, Strain CCMP 815" /LENGTH=89 /DNA_ID=CAMNT_0040645327 /DNA_START=92 /DNA_END=361 /DNA_ORIENTATION=-